MKSGCFVVSIVALLMTAHCTYYSESLLENASTLDANIPDPDSSVDSPNGDVNDTTPDADHGDRNATSDIEQRKAPDAPEPDASESDASESDGGTCDLLKPPLHPGGTDDGGDIEFTVAVSGIDFGDREGSDPNERGFDLDGCCTCGGSDPCHGSSTCLLPKMKDKQNPPNRCDGPRGQDNSVGKLMMPIVRLAGTKSNFGSENWTSDVENGNWSVIMHVSGYNGKANDASVELRWYIPGSFDDDKVPKTLPKWDGTDKWPILASCLEKDADDPDYDINKTKYKVSRAYVVNHTLVAGFSVVEFNVGLGYAVKLYATTLVAKLEQTAHNNWTFKVAEVTAVWKANDMLAQMPRLYVGGSPLCRKHAIYSLFKDAICNSADSSTVPASPTVACDGLSIGARLATLPALRGTIIPAKPEKLNPCAEKDGADPDVCNTE